MSLEISFHPWAEHELNEAARYYLSHETFDFAQDKLRGIRDSHSWIALRSIQATQLFRGTLSIPQSTFAIPQSLPLSPLPLAKLTCYAS